MIHFFWSLRSNSHAGDLDWADSLDLLLKGISMTIAITITFTSTIITTINILCIRPWCVPRKMPGNMNSGRKAGRGGMITV